MNGSRALDHVCIFQIKWFNGNKYCRITCKKRLLKNKKKGPRAIDHHCYFKIELGLHLSWPCVFKWQNSTFKPQNSILNDQNATCTKSPKIFNQKKEKKIFQRQRSTRPKWKHSNNYLEIDSNLKHQQYRYIGFNFFLFQLFSFMNERRFESQIQSWLFNRDYAFLVNRQYTLIFSITSNNWNSQQAKILSS